MILALRRFLWIVRRWLQVWFVLGPDHVWQYRLDVAAKPIWSCERCLVNIDTNGEPPDTWCERLLGSSRCSGPYP